MSSHSSPTVLPCPFCGAMPTVQRFKDSLGEMDYGVFCENQDCWVRPECRVINMDEAEHIAAWNGKRVPDSCATGTQDAPRIHGVTWVLLREDLISGETKVLLEKCPKKARVLGVGEWFVPGGKIEGDETPDEALFREVGEEWPGAEILSFAPLPIVEGSPVPPGPRGLFLMRPYVVAVSFLRCADGTTPDVNSEGTELRWVPVSEALASPVLQVRMMVAAAISPESASASLGGPASAARATETEVRDA